MSSLVEKAKNAAISVSLTKALEYLGKDPETNIPKVMNLVDKVAPDGWYEAQRGSLEFLLLSLPLLPSQESEAGNHR